MKWTNTKDKLPETDSQHGEDFLSHEVGVWTSEGFTSDRYRRTYDLKAGTGKLLSEGWCNEDFVEYWMQPVNPNIPQNSLPTDEEIEKEAKVNTMIFPDTDHYKQLSDEAMRMIKQIVRSYFYIGAKWMRSKIEK